MRDPPLCYSGKVADAEERVLKLDERFLHVACTSAYGYGMCKVVCTQRSRRAVPTTVENGAGARWPGSPHSAEQSNRLILCMAMVRKCISLAPIPVQRGAFLNSPLCGVRALPLTARTAPHDNQDIGFGSIGAPIFL